MKNCFLLITIFLLLCGKAFESYAQVRKSQPTKSVKSTGQRTYVCLYFPEQVQYGIPIYSNVSQDQKTRCGVLTSQDLYKVEPANFRGTSMWYKLYTLDGKYLGYISNMNFREAAAPVAPQFEMVHVEGGTFMMGDNSDPDASPVHEVTVSDFDICKFEVTPIQWRQIFGPKSSPNYSWNDVQNFIKLVNKLTKKNYRLPTEAEWEFAARGGNLSKGYKYSGSNDINKVGWCYSNTNLQGAKMMASGKKQPNELGIFDMSGNLWEYCLDYYNYYPEEKQINPVCKNNKDGYIVMRGGSAMDDAKWCVSTKRARQVKNSDKVPYGFRLVLDCTSSTHKNNIIVKSEKPSSNSVNTTAEKTDKTNPSVETNVTQFVMENEQDGDYFTVRMKPNKEASAIYHEREKRRRSFRGNWKLENDEYVLTMGLDSVGTNDIIIVIPKIFNESKVRTNGTITEKVYTLKGVRFLNN